MADRLRDLCEREQRIEIMRRNGEDFRDEQGNWLIALGNGFASALVRALHDDHDDDGDVDPDGWPLITGGGQQPNGSAA